MPDDANIDVFTGAGHKSHGRGTCQERDIHDILDLAGLVFDPDQNR